MSLAVVGGGGFLVWRYLDQDAATPPPPPPAAAAPVDADAAAAPEGPAPGPATAQGLLEAASRDGLLRKALADGDAVRRWAVVAANLALGESPRKELAALAPQGKFSVETAGGRAAISPRSYARYDAFADAVASIDAGAAASAWRALRPALQSAYRALGYPYPTIDSAMLRALRRLQQAPVRDGPVFVEADGSVYAFADERLEALGQVEKHLLRMGPRNARLVQAKARELEAALGLARPRVAAER
ncbi:MAG TPA: DUF3014 domain-containing protein [Anaeromyxobacter sp.]|nr:DUF3014 domain-containing protein [Anaeromyxobacter sp.]